MGSAWQSLTETRAGMDNSSEVPLLLPTPSLSKLALSVAEGLGEGGSKGEGEGRIRREQKCHQRK